MEDRKIPLFAFRMKAGSYKTEWELAVSREEISRKLEYLSAADSGLEKTDQWEMDRVIEIQLPDHEAKAIAGFLMGSCTSPAKAKSARANGAKGGRPKGTGKHQKAVAEAAEQAKFDTLPLDQELFPVETKKPKAGKK